MVDRERIELSSAPCKGASFPLAYRPMYYLYINLKIWWNCQGFHLESLSFIDDVFIRNTYIVISGELYFAAKRFYSTVP